MYSHMNNSIYYHLFDSIVNTYLIERCGLTPPSSPSIGLVVSSFCQVRLSRPVWIVCLNKSYSFLLLSNSLKYLTLA